jgi:Arc/MetJ-type ribon-helix-helix transcriptional regulator
MKVKTSVTLSEDLVEQMDHQLPAFGTRSNLIEVAVRAFLADLVRQEREARDIEIIDRNADRLNREALDVLSFQVEL